VYDDQVERLSGLPHFPALPAPKKELCRALRRISETDVDFLHNLISDAIDTAMVCPTPAQLIQMAGAKRDLARKSLGNPNCPECHGSGWVSSRRKVSVPGVGQYETDFAAACRCCGGSS
jgi:hypothetical protein